MQQHQMMMRGVLPQNLQPPRPMMVPPPPRPFVNPFLGNAPPRGFLTAAIAQQYQTSQEKNSKVLPSVASASCGSITSENVEFLQPVESSTPTKAENSPPVTPQKNEIGLTTPEKNASNEAFRLAFEHWRGVSADTPEVKISQ